MTPRAYAAAKALAVDPGATSAERENAAARVREYEAKHGKPAPASTLGLPRFGYQHQRQAGAAEHDMRDLCATCGKDWALHWMAPYFDGEAIRAEARTCGAFAPKMKPPRRPARPGVRVPWWTLELRKSTGTRLGLTYAFRCGLRQMRDEVAQPRARDPRGLYGATAETLEHIERGEVDWRWFPELKDDGGAWRPPAEMRAAMREQKRSTP